jgi:hypothetical protein
MRRKPGGSHKAPRLVVRGCRQAVGESKVQVEICDRRDDAARGLVHLTIAIDDWLASDREQARIVDAASVMARRDRVTGLVECHIAQKHCASPSKRLVNWPPSLANEAQLAARRLPRQLPPFDAGRLGVLGAHIALVLEDVRDGYDALPDRGLVQEVVRDLLGPRQDALGVGRIDIGVAGTKPSPSAADLISGHRQLIERAHARGLRVYGATLTPFEGAAYWTPEGEAKRQALNTWIRTSGAYDAVLDFAAVVQDPTQPSKSRAEYDSGDHLHLSQAGYAAMANGIDLQLFRPLEK